MPFISRVPRNYHLLQNRDDCRLSSDCCPTACKVRPIAVCKIRDAKNNNPLRLPQTLKIRSSWRYLLNSLQAMSKLSKSVLLSPNVLPSSTYHFAIPESGSIIFYRNWASCALNEAKTRSGMETHQYGSTEARSKWSFFA